MDARSVQSAGRPIDGDWCPLRPLESPETPATTILQGGLIAQAVGPLVLGLAATLVGVPAPVIALIALLAHRGGQAFTGASSYDLLARAVPDEARARGTSWVDFATIGAFGVRVWAAGPLADSAGLAVLSLVAGVLVALSVVAARHLSTVAEREGFGDQQEAAA